MSDASRDTLIADLVRRRGDGLVRYAFLLTGDVAAAQDLVQDALVKVFVRLRAHPETELAEAYVRRAIVNIYIDGHRRRRRFTDVRHLVATQDEYLGPDASASLDLHAALATLSTQERAAVVLRYFGDLTVAEVADEMGLALGTVKRYLHTAVGKLELRLGPLPPSNDGDPLIVSTAPRGRR